jgi:hypothetical protein
MTNVILFSLEKLHLRRITLPLNYEAIARANTPCAHRLSYLLFPHAIAGEIRVCARMDSDLSQRQERVRIDAAKSAACTFANWRFEDFSSSQLQRRASSLIFSGLDSSPCVKFGHLHGNCCGTNDFCHRIS